MEQKEGYGWIVYSAVLLVLVGINNLLWGIAAAGSNELFIDKFLYGDLTAWGVVWIIIGALEIVAGFAVLAKQQWARWFGIIMACFAVISAFFYMWTFPIWSLIVIILGLLVIYGLAEYGGREGMWE